MPFKIKEEDPFDNFKVSNSFDSMVDMSSKVLKNCHIIHPTNSQFLKKGEGKLMSDPVDLNLPFLQVSKLT